MSAEWSSEVTSPETTSNPNNSNSGGESAVNGKQEVLTSLLFPVSDDKMNKNHMRTKYLVSKDKTSV